MLFTDENILKESGVSDDIPSADSHDHFVITVKEEHIGQRTSMYFACEFT